MINKCYCCAIILCVYTSAIASENTLDEYAKNKSIWDALSLDSYQYTIKKSCFCMPEYMRITQVSIINGEVVSASYPDSEDKVPNQVFDSLLTIPQWFEKISSAIDNKQGSINVLYNNQLGYPVNIEIDMHKRRADDEISVLISDVVKQ